VFERREHFAWPENQLSEDRNKLLPAKLVYERLGISHMTAYRLKRAPGSGFPEWLYINGRKFMIEAELNAWVASRPRKLGSKSELQQVCEAPRN
jgi:predicted DNA-binding transcriptional regulator AlpA